MSELGKDGEPEPVGNEAQAKAARDFAATANETVQPEEVKPALSQNDLLEIKEILDRLPNNIGIKNPEVKAQGGYTPPTDS